MRIGVLSDTHMTSPDLILEHILEDILGADDMILHAGDIVSRNVLERLEKKNVVAVCGNMDDFEVAEVLPQKRIVSLAGMRIGLIHGWGAKQGLQERLINRLESEKLDIIVYGHSHVPFWGEVNGIRMFNPGAVARNPNTGRGTVGRLEIIDGRVEASLLHIDR